LGFLAITHWKYFWPIVKAGVFAVLLGLIRLLPPALLLTKFDDEFLGGYPTLADFVKSLFVIVPPEKSLEVRSMLSNLGWWEYDFYIGLAGVLFLLVFGLLFWSKKLVKHKGIYPQLALPMLALFLLSMGRVYRILLVIPIPLFSGERASIRMILLPMLFLMVIAAIHCQKWINKHDLSRERIARAAGFAFLLLLIHDLWQHLKVWQVTNAYTAFPQTPVNLAIKVAANHSDPMYTNLLIVSGIISAVSMLILLALVIQERRKTISLH
jgi:hypothetical protein